MTRHKYKLIYDFNNYTVIRLMKNATSMKLFLKIFVTMNLRSEGS